MVFWGVVCDQVLVGVLFCGCSCVLVSSGLLMLFLVCMLVVKNGIIRCIICLVEVFMLKLVFVIVCRVLIFDMLKVVVLSMKCMCQNSLMGGSFGVVLLISSMQCWKILLQIFFRYLCRCFWFWLKVRLSKCMKIDRLLLLCGFIVIVWDISRCRRFFRVVCWVLGLVW